MTIITQTSNDVADQETLMLPTPLLEQSSILPDPQLPESDHLIAINTDEFAPSSGVFPVAELQDEAILDISGAEEGTKEIRGVWANQDVLTVLETSKHLCEQFVGTYGIWPTEICLHWLSSLELLAQGYNGIYIYQDEQAVQYGYMALPDVPAILKIPFITNLSEQEDEIIVR
ncbi:MAG TPA: hypothetical protein VL461_09190 [Dictyobacter sp.]|nr:hypothetical protein [Dictyobacter sp.]